MRWSTSSHRGHRDNGTRCRHDSNDVGEVARDLSGRAGAGEPSEVGGHHDRLPRPPQIRGVVVRFAARRIAALRRSRTRVLPRRISRRQEDPLIPGGDQP